MFRRFRSYCLPVTAVLVAFMSPRWAAGQAGLSFGQQRPFVIGFIPVVGPGGAVGGVSIDAAGVVSRSDQDATGRLRDARERAMSPLGSALQAVSQLRKISLRGLIGELDARRRGGKPLADELQNLAGLTRVQYVLVYPELHDIVLAGPAEAWQVDDLGNVVGRVSGHPVVQLDDLIVALRSARQQLTSKELITCSIDPTKEGLQRYTRALASASQLDSAGLARLEAALGPQQVTITGVAPGTHFARVLLAADFLMKRLGMQLEPAPIEGLPSYLEMLQAPTAPLPKNSMPRWWMACSYEPLVKDERGLAWQIQGPGVQTLAEEGRQVRDGKVIAVKNSGPSLPQKWAQTMTARYDALAAKMPVFAELRNCFDLSVVAALLIKEDLPARADCDLSLLFDEKSLTVTELNAPRTIDSIASLTRKGRQTIISASGGVEIDPWSVVERTKVQPSLAERRAAIDSRPGSWWWD